VKSLIESSWCKRLAYSVLYCPCSVRACFCVCIVDSNCGVKLMCLTTGLCHNQMSVNNRIYELCSWIISRLGSWLNWYHSIQSISWFVVRFCSWKFSFVSLLMWLIWNMVDLYLESNIQALWVVKFGFFGII